MNDKWIEINYNYPQLVNVIKDLKCRVVEVIIKAGGSCKREDCCCFQRGYLCKVSNELLLLIKPEEKTKIYIPFDAVVAISAANVDECKQAEKGSREESYPEKQENDDDCEEENNDLTEEKNNELKEVSKNKEGSRVYGYGRKINIDFLKEKSNFVVTEINITELSLSICSDQNETNNTFIYYFHKDGINDQAVELLLSPSSSGYIESVSSNRAGTKVIIKGQGLVYLDSDNKGEYNFKLLVTKNRVIIKIYEGDNILENHSKTLVGICDQDESPFILQK